MDSKKDEDMKHLELLSKIKSMVEAYLFPTQYDTEDIAVEIFIELYEKKQYLSRLLVRNRCIDKIRHQTKIKFQSLENLPVDLADVAHSDPSNPCNEIVDLLIQKANLSQSERKEIYMAFYHPGEVIHKDVLNEILKKLKREYELIKEGQ